MGTIVFLWFAEDDLESYNDIWNTVKGSNISNKSNHKVYSRCLKDIQSARSPLWSILGASIGSPFTLNRTPLIGQLRCYRQFWTQVEPNQVSANPSVLRRGTEVLPFEKLFLGRLQWHHCTSSEEMIWRIDLAVESPMLKVLDCTRHTLAFGLLGVNVIGRKL